jgi:lipid II:glycine glycyltransferase (peptidoglycan interpeptide bridge formation enzyme)
MSEYTASLQPATVSEKAPAVDRDMKIVRHLEPEPWTDFVQQHPAGNIFHSPEMFQVYDQTKGYKSHLWAVVDDSDVDAPEILALMLPVEISLYNGPLKRVTTRAVVFGSALALEGPRGDAALEKMLQAYAADTGGAFLFTEMRNVSDLTPWQPVLERNGFAYEEHLNYVIDLIQPEDEMFGKVSRRTRSYIRKAKRLEEMEIREISDRDDLAVCYELLRQTYQNAQVPLSDISLFENAFDLLRPSGLARFVAIYLEGKPIAVTIDLYYKDRVYYWYGGMDRDYGKRHPNEYLRWHVISQGKQEGYEIFDFGGAGRPDQVYGVRDFKAKFGGDLVGYGRNVCEHSPRLLRLSTFGYGVVRKLL